MSKILLVYVFVKKNIKYEPLVLKYAHTHAHAHKL